MKKNLILILSLFFILLLLNSCKKSCECKQWTNNSIGMPYSVQLEGDGTKCSEYTTLDTLDGLVTGIECYDSE